MTTMTIGIDLGDRKSHACVLDEAGEVLWLGEFLSTRDGLRELLLRCPVARGAMEVGSHSRSASAVAKELGYEVIVASPICVRLICCGVTNSDRYYAEALARL